MSPGWKALLLDLGGVLYDGTRPIDGAAEMLDRARRKGTVLRFVTNTATKSRQAIIDDLRGMGMVIDESELFTAPMAAANYVRAAGLRPYCLVHPAIRGEFAGIPQHDPDCVVLGDARDGLTYDALNTAFRLCRQGAPLIAIGLNKYFTDDDGLMLDAGAYIRALEWAADTTAIIMGKPDARFFEQVVGSTPFNAAECLMVGDDVAADVDAAVRAGLQGCLVRTGKYRPGDEARLPASARVIDSVASLLD